MHSFIWKEGTNAEIARDVLAHGHFLVPIVYGIPWLERPSLLPRVIKRGLFAVRERCPLLSFFFGLVPYYPISLCAESCLEVEVCINAGLIRTTTADLSWLPE